MWPHKKQSRDTRSGDLATTRTNITNLVTQLKIGVFLMWYYLTQTFFDVVDTVDKTTASFVLLC
jgi:hypothetical protein